MKKLLIVALLGTLLVSCGEKKDATLSACYHGIVGDSNSVFTVDSQSGEKVSGSMAFVFAQKDSSYGTYKGIFKNGVLTATYTFWSEGIESVGTNVFEKNGENFIGQGYTYMPASDCAKFLKK
jgi:hypothetical protein